MGTASGIRAGAAYVEISGDDSPLQQRLAASQARLKQWAAENSGGVTISKATEGAIPQAGGTGGGFFSGSFRGTELFGTALRFTVAIQAARAAVKDLQVFTSLAAGDFDGMRKAAEALPLGMGDLVKELAPLADSAANWLVMHNRTWLKDVYAGKVSESARHETVDQYNRGQKAIEEVDKALARATMTAREFAKYQVDGMKLSADAADEVLAKNLRLIAVEEQKKAEAQLRSRDKDATEAVARARMELAKATMSEDDYLEMSVRLLGYSADKTAELLAYNKELSRVKREQAAEEERIKIEQAGTQFESDQVNKEIDRLQKEMEDAQRAAQSLTEQMMTPEERGKALVEKYKEMHDYGDISDETYNRAVQKALEDAAGQAAPEMRGASRGMFGAESAWMLGGASGLQEEMLSGIRDTAKNTAKVAELARDWGVASFS